MSARTIIEGEMSKTARFLQSAAQLAKKQGLDMEFTWQDLGDLYHVYGKAATPARFVAMLKRKKR